MEEDVLIIDYEKGVYGHSCLAIARKLNGGKIEVIKELYNDEADDMYAKLIGQ